MAAGEQGDHDLLNHLLLPDDNFGQFRLDLSAPGRQALDEPAIGLGFGGDSLGLRSNSFSFLCGSIHRPCFSGQLSSSLI